MKICCLLTLTMIYFLNMRFRSVWGPFVSVFWDPKTDPKTHSNPAGPSPPTDPKRIPQRTPRRVLRRIPNPRFPREGCVFDPLGIRLQIRFGVPGPSRGKRAPGDPPGTRRGVLLRVRWGQTHPTIFHSSVSRTRFSQS